MMRGVIQGGTASAAGVLGCRWPESTGTVNDHTDAWFTGTRPPTSPTWLGYP
jgi:membrane peptidoglycan carboxypeptidase